MTKQVGEWLPVIDVGGARTNLIFRHPINELFDVQVQNPLEGQVLSWDADNGYFEPRGSYGGGVSSLYALLEVSINPNTLPNNAVLTYDLANNVWIASPVDVPKIVELSDVDNIPLLNGHILIWESTISKWKPGFLNAVASINGKTGQVNLVTNDIPESPGRLFLTTANFNDLLAQSSINRLSDVSTSGSLNNQVLTVDAILTRKGRELLAKNDGSFRITQFALSDDEIDYTLYNPNNASGSSYYGQAIEGMPLLEAFPDETQIMKYKLTTLPRGTAKMPIINIGYTDIVLKQGASLSITPQTLNYLGGSNTFEASGYNFTIGDVRTMSVFNGVGINTDQATSLNSTTTLGTNVSKTVIGTTLNMTGTTINTLFGNQSQLQTILIVEGRDSGARVTVPITVTKTS
jgi:hypothetical protein